MSKTHPSELRARFKKLPRPVRVMVPVLLGVFIGFGHEGWRVSVACVFVSLVLALLILPSERRAATWFGWLLGLGYFAFTLRWIVEPFLVDPVRHGWMAPFAIALMGGGLALFWALAFWGARFIAGQRASVMLWLPITLTAAELLRGHVLSGFPWGLLSYTLIGSAADVWFAWIGPHGTGLLLISAMGVTAYCLHRGWTLIWLGLVGVVLVTLAVGAIGASTPNYTGKTVRLIQPNAPQHQKWDRDWMPVFFDRALAQTGAGEPVDVVIWPETSIPALLDFADPWIEQMSIAARGAPVVAGIQRREDMQYFNSAILIEGPTTVSAISDKAHLVPFGEYIPLAWLLKPFGFGTLVDQVAGFSAGTGDGVMQIDGLGLARVLICYEGIFPEDMQRGEVRPDVLLIITNDAWFGNNAGPRQHLVQARARAIEQGLPVIRAANTGISAVIDPKGRVLDSLPLNEAGYLDAAVPVALSVTLYARVGDWPLGVLLILTMVTGVALRGRIFVDPQDAHG